MEFEKDIDHEENEVLSGEDEDIFLAESDFDSSDDEEEKEIEKGFYEELYETTKTLKAVLMSLRIKEENSSEISMEKAVKQLPFFFERQSFAWRSSYLRTVPN